MAWSKSTRISVMIGLDTTFFLIELIAGIYSGSLALMADAFHMLNDIITLVIGLWAVNIAKRASSDKYTYGWLRAEILGAFANAVFLIALCVSICLEAIQRFLDPPEITNPLLILIVGSLGLASNFIGFFVLGGHGHSHGGGEHEHEDGPDHDHDHDHAPGASHDDLNAAEQGRATGNGQSGDAHITDENGRVADVFPEAVLGRMSAAAQQQQQQSPRHIRFNGEGGTSDPQSHGRTASRASNLSSRGRQRGRTNSLRQHRPLSDIESQSIHPASFRAEIMEASRNRPQDDSSDAEQGDETAVEDADTPHEESPLLGKANDRNSGRSSSRRSRRNSSIHRNHNHNKPRDAAKSSHGHDHGDMGMNAMILHVIGDMLGNVGVIATALIIWKTEWHYKYYSDPAISLFIALIISRVPCLSPLGRPRFSCRLLRTTSMLATCGRTSWHCPASSTATTSMFGVCRTPRSWPPCTSRSDCR